MFFRDRKKMSGAAKAAADRRSNNIPSIMSADMTVKGDFYTKGSLEVEGEVEGNIYCDVVTVRRTANVKGNISANDVFLDGRVNGMIKGKNILVSPGATVSGVIFYDTLTVKDGASLNAQCKSLSELLSGGNGKPAADKTEPSGEVSDELFEEMTLIQDVRAESADAKDDGYDALISLGGDFDEDYFDKKAVPPAPFSVAGDDEDDADEPAAKKPAAA
jgi:cytoskeletal protein CcmA (bactofilin family)